MVVLDVHESAQERTADLWHCPWLMLAHLIAIIQFESCIADCVHVCVLQDAASSVKHQAGKAVDKAEDALGSG